MNQVEAEVALDEASSLSSVKTGRLIFLSALGLVASGYTYIAFTDLSIGRLGHIGSGFFPMVIGIGILISCVCGVIGELKEKASAGVRAWPEGKNLVRMFLFIGLLAVNVFGIYIVGIFFSSLIASTLTARLIARIAWWKAALFGIIFTLIVNWFFSDVMNIFLPTGMLPGQFGF